MLPHRLATREDRSDSVSAHRPAVGRAACRAQNRLRELEVVHRRQAVSIVAPSTRAPSPSATALPPPLILDGNRSDPAGHSAMVHRVGAQRSRAEDAHRSLAIDQRSYAQPLIPHLRPQGSGLVVPLPSFKFHESLVLRAARQQKVVERGKEVRSISARRCNCRVVHPTRLRTPVVGSSASLHPFSIYGSRECATPAIRQRPVHMA